MTKKFISFIVEVRNYQRILSQMYNGERFSDQPDAIVHPHEDFEMVDRINLGNKVYFFFKVGGNFYTSIMSTKLGDKFFDAKVGELNVRCAEGYGSNYIVIDESKITKLSESEFNEAHTEIARKSEILEINSKNPELTRELLSLPAWIEMDNPKNIIEKSGDQFNSVISFNIGRLTCSIHRQFVQNPEIRLFFDSVLLYTGTTRGTEYIGEWHHNGDWQFDIMNDIRNLKDSVQASKNLSNKKIQEILSKY